MLSKLFLIFVIFFATGVFIGSFINFSLYFGLFFVFLGLIFLALRSPALPAGRFSVAGVFALILFAIGAGLFWYGLKSVLPDDISIFEEQVGVKISLQGVVVDEPDERENYTRYIVELGKGINMLITAHHYPSFEYGDKVEVKGILKKPKDFSEFSWSDYLAKDDIFFEIFYPEIKLIASNQGSFIKYQLLSLKEKILSNVSLVIPEPHSALLGGLTFGAKRSMPSELLEDFRKTGIIHIVVLSGYNVTIVADAIMRVFSFLPFLFGIGFGVLGIMGFAIMAGASATVVRASLMAILVLLARATGRIYEITIALFAAGFLMLLHNPKILRFDASFQLSFLATIALIYVVPIIEPHLKFFPKKWKIREVASATIATQIFVLPLLLYKMGLFSVVSLPVNLLILLFIPATMFFGFVTAAAGFISTLISTPLGWITYGLLEYQLKVVELFSALPFVSFNIPNFPLWLMLLVYVTYAILFVKLRSNLK